MFAGVSAILLDDDNNQVLGLSSKEGEEVRNYEITNIVMYCNYRYFYK